MQALYREAVTVVDVHDYTAKPHGVVLAFPKLKSKRFVCVSCGDGNYMPALFEYLQPFVPFGVDYLVSPGGPRSLYRDLMDPSRVGVGLKDLEFYMTHNGPREVFLVGHTGCGKYRVKHPDRARHIHALDDLVIEHLVNLKKLVLQSTSADKVHLLFMTEDQHYKIDNPDQRLIRVTSL